MKPENLIEAIVAVGDGLDLASTLERIVQLAVELADASYGALGVWRAEDSDEMSYRELAEFVHVGIPHDTAEQIGNLPRGHGILGLVGRIDEPLRLSEMSAHPDSFGFPKNHPPMRSFLGVPIRIREEKFGTIYLTEKKNGAEFTTGDEEMILALAKAAGVAIQNARVFDQFQRLRVLEERDRIARDLHDLVIQRLFATGIMLQTAAQYPGSPPEVTQRVEEAVDELDRTVREIRHTIFNLHESERIGLSLRSVVLQEARTARNTLGFSPQVRFTGPVDVNVDAALIEDVLATVREALTNVARHAKASSVQLTVSILGDQLLLEVIDDGIGLTGSERFSGLRNMAVRAEVRGGTSEVAPAIPKAPEGSRGTRVSWAVPLEAAEVVQEEQLSAAFTPNAD